MYVVTHEVFHAERHGLTLTLTLAVGHVVVSCMMTHPFDCFVTVVATDHIQVEYSLGSGS